MPRTNLEHNSNDCLLLRRFMAFDRHMNLVLGDAEEYRKLPPKKGRSEDEVRVFQSCSALFSDISAT